VTGVLAAAARAVLRAVLVLAAAASVLWAATGAPGLAGAGRLAVMSAAVGGAAAVLEWLRERRRKGARDG